LEAVGGYEAAPNDIPQCTAEVGRGEPRREREILEEKCAAVEERFQRRARPRRGRGLGFESPSNGLEQPAEISPASDGETRGSRRRDLDIDAVVQAESRASRG
jgi:hypothetical protein